VLDGRDLLFVLEVCEVLLLKKGKLIGMLKGLVAKVPRSMMAAANAHFSELEQQISAKPASIEELDRQRRCELMGLTDRLVKCWRASGCP
jgi:hypothetical protein